MAPARPATTLVAAIASAVVALAVAVATTPTSGLRPLAGSWRLDSPRSPAGRAERGDAPSSLRIDVDGPIVSLKEAGHEPRTLWVGGPPVEASNGAARETRGVSWTADDDASFPALPAAAAIVALALVALAECGLARRPGRRSGPKGVPIGR